MRSTSAVGAANSLFHSWNKNLTYKRGAAMGSEFKIKGANVLLGPVVGPMGRVVLGGRNWEGFTPDPYLAGSLVYESTKGIQDQGVITSTKVSLEVHKSCTRSIVSHWCHVAFYCE